MNDYTSIADLRFAFPDLSSLSAAASAAGLAVVDRFGDHDESAYEPERSPFIIAMLARPSTAGAAQSV